MFTTIITGIFHLKVVTNPRIDKFRIQILFWQDHVDSPKVYYNQARHTRLKFSNDATLLMRNMLTVFCP